MFDVAQQKWYLSCDNVTLWVDQKRICWRWLSEGTQSNQSACKRWWKYSLMTVWSCTLHDRPLTVSYSMILFQASDLAVNSSRRKNPPPGCWGCWTPSSHGVWWRPRWSTGNWKWRTASRGRRICQSQRAPFPFQSPWEHLRVSEKVRQWALLPFIEAEKHRTITLGQFVILEMPWDIWRHSIAMNSLISRRLRPLRVEFACCPWVHVGSHNPKTCTLVLLTSLNCT